MKLRKYLIALMIIVIAVSLPACAKVDEVPVEEPVLELIEEPVIELTEEPKESANNSSSAGRGIIKVTEDDFKENVLDASGVMLVDFWAEWCGPCLTLAPILEEVNEEAGITIAKVNVDENPALADHYKINAIPAVYVFADGEHVDTLIGVNPKENYLNTIAKYQ